MDSKSEILGYYILPYDFTNDEGIASTSLEDLIEKEYKIPFLNKSRLQDLKCKDGLKTKAIDDIVISEKPNTEMGWSPTGRFLEQMAGKLRIASNR